MKPGQTIEIAPGSHAELAPIRGHVARVTEDELLVDLDHPRRGSFAPQSTVTLTYAEDGTECEVEARVAGMPGPGRLLLTVRGDATPARDARAHVRIEHLLRMEYHVIARHDLEAMRLEVLNGPRILKYEWQPPAFAVAAGAENEGIDPGWDGPASERLTRMERKIDALLERLGVETPGAGEKPLYNVSLSARGLRFRYFQQRCQAGDMVHLCLELPMSPTVEVTALAETVYVVEDARRNLSAGRDVILEFREIKEEARQQIQRYCQSHQDSRRIA